jgi:hypothetical protein
MRSLLLPGQTSAAIAVTGVEIARRSSASQPSLPERERISIQETDAEIEAWLNEGGAGAAGQHGDSRRGSPPPAA